MIMNNDAVAIQSYTLSELAELYGVTNRTMRNWLTSHKHEIGIDKMLAGKSLLVSG